MELYLVQHAESKPKEEDPDRSLTVAGAAAAQRMAAWAAHAGLAVDRFQHSGKTRAEQTASILADALSEQAEVQARPGIAPLDDPQPVADEMQAEQEPLMLVGHLPFHSRLAGMLLAGDPERELVTFENAGIVCLRRSEGKWSLSWAMLPRLVPSG